ncbi:MAG: hypothetical protein KUG81_10545 [Gammaproteobacteria bacterium]|nr:hypothetical protein [Gammaproteobacteria bacterium]
MKITPFRLLIGIIGVIYSLAVFNGNAYGAFQKPNVVDTQSTSELAKVVKDAISFLLNAVMAIGALAAAISLAMMTPYIGEPEKGKRAFKGSIGVIVGAGLFEMFISWVFTLF